MIWFAPGHWISLLSAKDPRVPQKWCAMGCGSRTENTFLEAASNAKRLQLSRGKRHYLWAVRWNICADCQQLSYHGYTKPTVNVPVDAPKFTLKTDCHRMEERKSLFLLYGWCLSSTGIFTLSFSLAFAWKLQEKTKEDELCFCENTQCTSLIRQDRITLKGESQSWKETRAGYEVTLGTNFAH